MMVYDFPCLYCSEFLSVGLCSLWWNVHCSTIKGEYQNALFRSKILRNVLDFGITCSAFIVFMFIEFLLLYLYVKSTFQPIASSVLQPIAFISSFRWIRFCKFLTCLRRKFISKGSLTPQELLGVSLCNNCSHNLEFTGVNSILNSIRFSIQFGEFSILRSIIPVPPTFRGRLFLVGVLNKSHIFLCLLSISTW